MGQNNFSKIMLVAQAALDFIAQSPDGVTLRQFNRHVKGLLSRHGLEVGAYVVYDQMCLDILETAKAVTRIIEPREPTRLVVATKGD